MASGAFNAPRVPAVSASLPAALDQVTPLDYKRPDQLRGGRVLVVGASATGLQLADELLASGREVTIAVGEHVRMPRTYRGRDVMWWLGELGRLDERYDEVDDLVRARHVPSPQLVGTPDRADLDLNALTARGASLVGRLAAVNGGTASFSGSLRNVCTLADLKLKRLLTTIDQCGRARRGPASRADRVDDHPRVQIDLVAEGFDTVLWATGFRADYSWLDVPVCDRKGEIRHDGGVVLDAPGLYRVGLNFLRRRKSSFIHGAEDDAREHRRAPGGPPGRGVSDLKRAAQIAIPMGGWPRRGRAEELDRLHGARHRASSGARAGSSSARDERERGEAERPPEGGGERGRRLGPARQLVLEHDRQAARVPSEPPTCWRMRRRLDARGTPRRAARR